MDARGNRRSGFTLIELLVVISIIALLISMLMPSLAQSRAAARMVICQANIRSVSIGVTSYADDEREYLPWVYIDAGVPGYPDGDVFSNMFVRRGYVTAPSGLTTGSVFRCPEQVVLKNVGTVGWAAGGGPHRTEKHFMYTYPTMADPTGDNPLSINGVAVPTWYLLAGGNHLNWTFQWIRAATDWNRTRKSSQVQHQSSRVMLAEQSNINASSPTYGEGRIAGRHGPIKNGGFDGMANMAFFDGHVQAVDTSGWYAGLSVKPIRYLWID